MSILDNYKPLIELDLKQAEADRQAANAHPSYIDGNKGITTDGGAISILYTAEKLSKITGQSVEFHLAEMGYKLPDRG